MAAAFVFLIAFAAYAWTASPVMGWLDAPEFVAASASLGVPHSPGHPLPVLAGKLGALVPVGDVALRVNLMSAMAAAGAVTVFQAALRHLLAVAAPALPAALRQVVAISAALILALSWAMWLQGVRAEVYALVALLAGASLAVLVRSAACPGAGWTRAWYAAGLLGGLALATHHFIALTVLVPVAILALAQRLGRRTMVITGALLLLGLAAFLYLPVRSAQHPTVNWGAPHTASRLAWTVSARAFHKSTTLENVSSRAEDTAQVIGNLAEQATWPLALIALVGLYLGARTRTWRPAALVLGGVVALGAGGRVLIGFDPDLPDHQGYLVPALAALLALAVAGAAVAAAALAHALPGWRRAVHVALAACFLLLVPVQAARFGGVASLAGERASDEMARWELDGLPPRALLLSAYYETSFRIWAMRTVEDARPDVTILDRSFLTYPGMAGEARRAHPELAALVDAPLRAGAPTPVAELARLAARRPVMLQLHPNLEPAVDPWLVPAGAFARLVPAALAPAERARAEVADGHERRRLVARTLGHARGDPDRPGGPAGLDLRAALDLPAGLDLPAALAALPAEDRRGLRSALLWHDFVRLSLYCRQGRRHAAQATLNDALQLAPGDRMLVDLAHGCSLSLP